MSQILRAILAFLVCSTSCIQCLASTSGQKGMVVTAHPVASEVGIRIIEKGGNAFDAAIAVQFALAVVYPQAGNISGGGFLVYSDKDGEVGSLDFREKAPLAATATMYLDANGDVIKGASQNGALAVGVPGSVAGMVAIHKKFGSLPWKELVQPSIELANNGYVLTEYAAFLLNQKQRSIREINSKHDSQRIPFLKPATLEFEPGQRIRIPALAKTFERIRDKGCSGFYEGKTADAIVRCVQSNGGIITHEDLKKYRAIWREPVSAKVWGHDIISMGPPSSGGIALLQLLKGSETFDWQNIAPNSADEAHLMTELMRRVYADRATYLGDSDFVQVPQSQLLDENYIRKRNVNIDPDHATPSQSIKEGSVQRIESYETTHFSIADHLGNSVSITTTLNSHFGSKLFVPDAGFFLNNEMDDFSIKPGHPNQFGLVGSEANAIAPEKRMLSSMSPTIVLKDGNVRYILGTPGGSTIITNVYQTLINLLVHEMPLQEAVDDKKIHAQWLPDRIHFETGALDLEVQEVLKQKGHALHEIPQIGRLEAIEILDNGTLIGAADESRTGDACAKGI